MQLYLNEKRCAQRLLLLRDQLRVAADLRECLVRRRCVRFGRIVHQWIVLEHAAARVQLHLHRFACLTALDARTKRDGAQ